MQQARHDPGSRDLAPGPLTGALQHDGTAGQPGRRPWRPRLWKIVALVVALDVVAIVAGTAIGGYELLSVQRQASGLGADHLSQKAAAIDGDLHVAGVAFGLARLCWWPWRLPAGAIAAAVGPVRLAGAMGPLLDLAADGSAAGARAADGAMPVLAALGPGQHAKGDAGARLLAGLQRGHGALQEAVTGLQGVAADWSSLDLAALPSSWQARLQPLGRGLATATDVLHLAVLAPNLLGASRPHDYLLVPQNPWDLRATGGFASTEAVLEARQGHLSLAGYRSSDKVDAHRLGYVPPPLPWTLYAHSSNWFYRDANWSPDFPTSAALLRYFYYLGQKHWPDGVIAFDSALLSPLLQITGPVQVHGPKGMPVTLTAQNGVQTLDQYVNSGSTLNKGFAGAAYLAIFRRLRALSSTQLSAAARALGQALQQKHLLVWLPDGAVAPILARHDWDGAVDPTRHDYLYVTDTNVHYNKISQLVREGLIYRATVQPDRSLRSTLTITYTNTATPRNLPQLQDNTLYEDFIRVYVPLGSRLLSASGLTQPWPAARSHDKAIFAGYLRLASGHSATVTFTYMVPPNALLDAPVYQLTIQKQPGTGAMPLRVQLQAGAPGLRVGGGASWNWQGQRLTDVTLTTALSGGQARPIPLAYDAGQAVAVGPGSEIEPGVVVSAPTLPDQR